VSAMLTDQSKDCSRASDSAYAKNKSHKLQTYHFKMCFVLFSESFYYCGIYFSFYCQCCYYITVKFFIICIFDSGSVYAVVNICMKI